MPILKREPELSPATLFSGHEGAIPWWVAHVRSRQEKALARHLRPLEIAYYLPQHEVKRRRMGRRVVSFVPVFPGYVFLRGPADIRIPVLNTQLVVRVLRVPDQLLLTRELTRIRELQERGLSLLPHAYIAIGQEVRVADGPFKGYGGVVLRGRGKDRLVVSVSMVQRSVSVELPREDVDPVTSFPG